MTQVILVFVVVLIGALVCAASVIQKSTKFVKKYTSSKEYEELAEMYDEAMEENPTDNMFISLYDDIEEHNKKVSENTEYRVTRLPKTNEVCFDTSKYGFQINSFGFVKITHKTKRKVKTSQFPLYLKATKANILTGFVPFPDTGIQLGSGTDVATVLFGNEKESIKKIQVGDRVEISTLYGRRTYDIITIICASRDGLKGPTHPLNINHLVMIIGNTDKYLKNICFCKLVRTDAETF